MRPSVTVLLVAAVLASLLHPSTATVTFVATVRGGTPTCTTVAGAGSDYTNPQGAQVNGGTTAVCDTGVGYFSSISSAYSSFDLQGLAARIDMSSNRNIPSSSNFDEDLTLITASETPIGTTKADVITNANGYPYDKTVGGATDLWGTTGLLSSAIMSPSFGLSLQITSTKNSGEARCDFMTMTAYLSRAVTATGISPDVTPQDTVITVSGTGFYNDGSGILCRFDNSETTAATYVSPTRITCTVPDLGIDPIEQVSVDVSFNGGDLYTNDPISFRYDQGTIAGIPTNIAVRGGASLGGLFIAAGFITLGLVAATSYRFAKASGVFEQSVEDSDNDGGKDTSAAAMLKQRKKKPQVSMIGATIAMTKARYSMMSDASEMAELYAQIAVAESGKSKVPRRRKGKKSKAEELDLYNALQPTAAPALPSEVGEVDPAIYAAVTYLHAHAREEGLLRVTGGASAIKQIADVLAESPSADALKGKDPHAVASFVKTQYRRRSKPYMSDEQHNEFLRVQREAGGSKLLHAARYLQQSILPGLSTKDRQELELIVRLAQAIAREQKTNRMNESNLAMVLGPTVILAADMATSRIQGSVLVMSVLIRLADIIFTDKEVAVPSEPGDLTSWNDATLAEEGRGNKKRSGSRSARAASAKKRSGSGSRPGTRRADRKRTASAPPPRKPTDR